jgi:hypothetical protein
MPYLPVEQIEKDATIQPRLQTYPHVVDEYAAAMRKGAVFPPVVVFFDGTTNWLAEGFHRLEAVEKIGRKEILADIRPGSKRDAMLHAAASNAAHGLRRTQEDKRRAVATLLQDEEWSKWSDREIGRHCCVDHKTVASVRNSLGKSPLTEAVVYKTKHGTVSTMKRPISLLTNMKREWIVMAEHFDEDQAEENLQEIREAAAYFENLGDSASVGVAGIIRKRWLDRD